MAQHIKPSGTPALDTGHALYSAISRFLVFGGYDRELVENTALTVTGAAVVTDSDIGSARAFVTGSAVAETVAMPETCTILVITAGRGVRYGSSASDAVFIGHDNSGNSVRFGWTPSSYGRVYVTRRGSSGATRTLYGASFASDGDFNTGLAVAATVSATATMKTCVNGTVSGTTDTGTTGALSSSPFNVPIGTPMGASANFPIGGIVIFNRVLTDQELIDVTNVPWGLLLTPASIVSVDGDNSISQGQQDIQTVVNNIPAGNVPVRIGAGGTNGVGGTDFTGFSAVAGGTAGTFTITADVPIGIATSSSVQCYVEYAPE